MVILKKLTYNLKSFTIIETLVATVLIVLTFMLASMILNNLFSSSLKNNIQPISNYLNELQYLELHNQLELPYLDVFKNWNIHVNRYQHKNLFLVKFEAVNNLTDKTITIIKSEE